MKGSQQKKWSNVAKIMSKKLRKIYQFIVEKYWNYLNALIEMALQATSHNKFVLVSMPFILVSLLDHCYETIFYDGLLIFCDFQNTCRCMWWLDKKGYTLWVRFGKKAATAEAKRRSVTGVSNQDDESKRIIEMSELRGEQQRFSVAMWHFLGGDRCHKMSQPMGRLNVEFIDAVADDKKMTEVNW